RLAAQIFVQNSPIQPLPEGLEDDLANGNTSFSLLSPKLAATPKGRAAQLAGKCSLSRWSGLSTCRSMAISQSTQQFHRNTNTLLRTTSTSSTPCGNSTVI